MKKDFFKEVTDRIASHLTKPVLTSLQSRNLIKIKNLSGSLKSLFIHDIFEKTEKQLIIFCKDSDIAEDFYHDLSILNSENKIILLSEPKHLVKFDTDSDEQQQMWIIEGLSNIINNEKSVLIITPEILDYELPTPKNIIENKKTLKVNTEIDFDQFTKELLLNGFERKEFVETQGDIAIRGGIVDVFPYSWSNPLRIVFFGNEIESLRDFDPLSQRSIQSYQQIEFITKIFHSDIEFTRTKLIDYISNEPIFIIDQQDFISDRSMDSLFRNDAKKILFSTYSNESDFNIKSIKQPEFKSSVKVFVAELRKIINDGLKIYICAEGKIHLDRIKDLIEGSFNYLSESKDSEEEFIKITLKEFQTSIKWLEKTFTHGFISEELGIALFTEHEVFNRLRIQDVRKVKRKSGGLTLKELKQLKICDFVVHTDKGIGRFEGLFTIKLGENTTECAKLTYQDGDILYVDVFHIYKISKYSAEEGTAPKLSKLGSNDWDKKRSKVKKRLKDIARDLIKLYARRKAAKGFAYPEDTIWQKELEAAFIYEDTPDQQRTTLEVKKDMENETPMDRLICGDVGFGKTEIAVRAAFKAAQSEKQVCILAPTTVLAQQHFMTFRDRLVNYPVIVDVLSRFKSKQEQKVTIEKLKTGKIDILIGTHRLLSKDIEYKNLGLLVIDEEHRFGVGAKEKLRMLKANIDTLTLTATPIPRTLNFSLMGVRDLSIMETPPRNRLPVNTEIAEWNDKVLVKAINDEINRGGQVFFVNDRIDDLERIRMNLQMLMPILRFGIAHGQMTPEELETTMEKFIEAKFDVLLTTKIIESGLDIPNANTIIINRSHRFGLAELYQLRGRVGRSNVQAYCYLIIPPANTLSKLSIKRLQAIEEFTDLGSGFQLAMRDLEIRGAGDLLGPEQSGYINEIGFELYHKTLDEAVKELRKEEFADVFDKPDEKEVFNTINDDIQITIGEDALIPADYIKSDSERFSYYKRLYDTKNNSELSEITNEIIDKFGKAPKETKELFFVIKLRIAVLNTGFTKINLKKGKLIAEFPSKENSEFYTKIFPLILDIINLNEDYILSQDNDILKLEIPISNKNEAIEAMWRIKKNIDAHITNE